jgi:hypothetical protein
MSKTPNPQRIVVGSQGVERVLSDSTVIYPWHAIVQIEETSRAFLLLGPSGPTASIEKSSIASAGELQALRAFLRAKRPGKYLHAQGT